VKEAKARWRHLFRCRTCGNQFHVDRLTPDPNKVKAPKCPRKKCGGKSKESFMADVGFDPSEGKAPSIGGSIIAKATDMAWEVGAANAGLTDINTQAREGENSAPKLPPNLQQMADNFWGTGKPQAKRKTMGKVDLSPIYGERAGQAAAGAVNPYPNRVGAKADEAIMPIHRAGQAGQSAVPPHITIAGD